MYYQIKLLLLKCNLSIVSIYLSINQSIELGIIYKISIICDSCSKPFQPGNELPKLDPCCDPVLRSQSQSLAWAHPHAGTADAKFVNVHLSIPLHIILFEQQVGLVEEVHESRKLDTKAVLLRMVTPPVIEFIKSD